MKALIITTLVGIGMIASPVYAKDMTTIWTTISESAPRSVFDDLRDSAPRSDLRRPSRLSPPIDLR